MNKYINFLKVETPMHMGSGVELGIVDMPIQRELVTKFPKAEASGIKGALRVELKNKIKNHNNDKQLIDIVFGPEEDGSEYSSCIRITDAKILFFPVKTAKGIFCWITCPFVLERFVDECNIFGFQDFKKNDKIVEKNMYYSDTSNTLIERKKNENVKSNKEKIVIIEEYSYSMKRMDIGSESYRNIEKIINCIANNDEESKLKKDIMILSNEDFRFFVTMSTEVNTRIRIGENGIVKEGGLFTEEYLPSESILYNFIEFTEPKYILTEKEGQNTEENLNREYDIVVQAFENLNCIQLGGNKTLGKGITSIYKKRRADHAF